MWGKIFLFFFLSECLALWVRAMLHKRAQLFNRIITGLPRGKSSFTKKLEPTKNHLDLPVFPKTELVARNKHISKLLIYTNAVVNMIEIFLWDYIYIKITMKIMVYDTFKIIYLRITYL